MGSKSSKADREPTTATVVKELPLRTIRAVLAGDSRVGKSNLQLRFAGMPFSEEYYGVLGVSDGGDPMHVFRHC